MAVLLWPSWVRHTVAPEARCRRASRSDPEAIVASPLQLHPGLSARGGRGPSNAIHHVLSRSITYSMARPRSPFERISTAWRSTTHRPRRRSPHRSIAAPALAAEAEGRITELFGQWQPAVDAVWRAEAKDGDFLRAFRAEHALRQAIGQALASSLRELQMLAFAVTSDGAGLGGLAHAERMLADDIAWVAKHGRDASYFPWRIPAFALAVPLMRMAWPTRTGRVSRPRPCRRSEPWGRTCARSPRATLWRPRSRRRSPFRRPRRRPGPEARPTRMRATGNRRSARPKRSSSTAARFGGARSTSGRTNSRGASARRTTLRTIRRNSASVTTTASPSNSAGNSTGPGVRSLMPRPTPEVRPADVAGPHPPDVADVAHEAAAQPHRAARSKRRSARGTRWSGFSGGR